MKTQTAKSYITTKNNWNGVALSHRIQNQIIRDYAHKNNLLVHLSHTEFSSGNHIVLKELSLNCHQQRYKHLIIFSLTTLPQARQENYELLRNFTKNDIFIHFALEEKIIKTSCEVEQIEELIYIHHHSKKILNRIGSHL